MRAWLSSLCQRAAALLQRRRLEQDLQDEIAFHVAMREEQLRAAGAADAGIDARRRCGNTVRMREELRDAWAVAPGLAGFVQDLGYALHTLRRYPAAGNGARGLRAAGVSGVARRIARRTARAE